MPSSKRLPWRHGTEGTAADCVRTLDLYPLSTTSKARRVPPSALQTTTFTSASPSLHGSTTQASASPVDFSAAVPAPVAVSEADYRLSPAEVQRRVQQALVEQVRNLLQARLHQRLREVQEAAQQTVLLPHSSPFTANTRTGGCEERETGQLQPTALPETAQEAPCATISRSSSPSLKDTTDNEPAANLEGLTGTRIYVPGMSSMPAREAAAADPALFANVIDPHPYSAVELVRVRRLKGSRHYNRGLFAGLPQRSFTTRSGQLVLGTAGDVRRVRPAVSGHVWRNQQRHHDVGGKGNGSAGPRLMGLRHGSADTAPSLELGQGSGQPATADGTDHDQSDLEAALLDVMNRKYGQSLTPEERVEALRRLRERRRKGQHGSGSGTEASSGTTQNGAERVNGLLPTILEGDGTTGATKEGRSGRKSAAPDETARWSPDVHGDSRRRPMSASGSLPREDLGGNLGPRRRRKGGKDAGGLSTSSMDRTLPDAGGGGRRPDTAAGVTDTGKTADDTDGARESPHLSGSPVAPPVAVAVAPAEEEGIQGEDETPPTPAAVAESSLKDAALLGQDSTDAKAADAPSGLGAEVDQMPETPDVTDKTLDGMVSFPGGSVIPDGTKTSATVAPATPTPTSAIAASAGTVAVESRTPRSKNEGLKMETFGDRRADSKAKRSESKGALDQLNDLWDDNRTPSGAAFPLAQFSSGDYRFPEDEEGGADDRDVHRHQDGVLDDLLSDTAEEARTGRRARGVAGRGKQWGKKGKDQVPRAPVAEAATPKPLRGFDIDEAALQTKFRAESAAECDDLVQRRAVLLAEVAAQRKIIRDFSDDVRFLSASDGNTEHAAERYAIALTTEVHAYALKNQLNFDHLFTEAQTQRTATEEEGDRAMLAQVAAGFLDHFMKERAPRRDVGCQVTDADVAYVDERVLTTQAELEDLYHHEKALLHAVRLATVAVANIMSFHASLEMEATCHECFLIFDKPRTLWPCGHTFCLGCLAGMYNRGGNLICNECGSICEVGVTPNIPVELTANYQTVYARANAMGRDPLNDSAAHDSDAQTIEGVLRELLNELLATQDSWKSAPQEYRPG